MIGRSFVSPALASIGVVLLLLVGPGWAAATPAMNPAGAPGGHGPASPGLRPSLPSNGPRDHPPALQLGRERSTLGPRPAQTSDFYTQEGATLSQVNGSGASAGIARLSEYVRLVTSPYSTAYELNGLSSTGDWWQIVIGDNWPGCNAGFEEATEVWNNQQTSGPITCDSNVTLSAGDQIEFSIYFSAGNGCMLLRDVTTSTSHTLCDAQPDSGATKWVFQTSAANGNGYFTGPMTETVNLTASSCPDYTNMPRVDYEFANGTFVTEYVAWSDEFDYATGTRCYQIAEPVQTIAPGDPASYLVDTASGTGDGPHWEDGQNFSLLNRSYGWRFETDPKPMTSVDLNASATTVQAGRLVSFSLSVGGGVSPYDAFWTLDGALQPLVAATTWSWNAGVAGKYSFLGYAVDQQLDVFGPSNKVVITVPGPLQAPPIVANPGTGTDVGFPVRFSDAISGGFGYWAITWSGLPTGCTGANSTSVNCTPTQAGPSNVSVSVKDANGSVANSGNLPYRVYAALGIGVTTSGPAIDVGETATFRVTTSGGAGGDRFSWSTPSGCLVQGLNVTCTPTLPTELILSVSVTDAAGATASGGGVVGVNPAPVLSVPATQLVVDAGAAFSTSVVVTGGTAPFSYHWTGLPTGCDPTGPVAKCTLLGNTTLTVGVTVTDAAGVVATGPNVDVEGVPPPSISVGASVTSSYIGDTVSFNATARGGTQPYVFAWSGLPGGCAAANTPTIVCAPGSPGNYTVTVTLTDRSNVSVHASTPFSVLETPVGPGGGGVPSFGGWALWIALGIVAVIVVAAVAVWARRRA